MMGHRYRLAAIFVIAGVCLSAQQHGSYIGAGGCSSSNCHGSTTIATEANSRIWTNEYAIWATFDKHSRAAKILTEPRSRRMGEILGLANPATDQRCTVCHVVGSPAQSASDGVSCEACHGAAKDWLGPHTQKNSHSESVSKGMTDTKNPVVEAALCMSCHLGNAERQVDHELIAAGHPDLAFELDTFTHAEPVHYRPVPPSPGNSLPRVRAWAVGQTVQLAQGMKLLAIHANKNWPEFSELECYQCHHDLRAESWRIQQRGYAGRKPGSLQVNLARLDVVRVLAAQAGPGAKSALDAALTKLTNTVSARAFDGPAIAQAAESVEQNADALTSTFDHRDFNATETKALIRALNAEVTRIANSGVQSAEQATMALDALTSASARPNDKLPEPMKELYDYLEHPSTYQPREFAALFHKAASRAE